MIGVNGLAAQQITRDVNAKNSTQNVESDFSFSESMKEIVKEYTEKVASMTGFSLEKPDFWKKKLEVSKEKPKIQDNIYDIMSNIEKEIAKLLKDNDDLNIFEEKEVR